MAATVAVGRVRVYYRRGSKWFSACPNLPSEPWSSSMPTTATQPRHLSQTNPEMSLLTDTASLDAFCERLAGTEFVTVDTEFMRETTYWAKLCLVQVAGPDEAHCIDPLAPGIDLTSFHKLLANPAI